MNLLDEVRITRILDAAGYNGADIINVLKSAGIHMTVDYESTKVLMNNAEHGL